MGSTIAAMGRAGTLRSLADTIRERRERKAGEAATEEQERISNIRVPISQVRPQAMPTPIGEAIEERKVQRETAATGPTVVPEEVSAAKQQYEETNKAIQEKKDLEVRAVEELPIMKSLAPYPTAKNRVFQLAEANGWVKMIGGVPTISNKQMQIAQKIIASDLELRKNINELALGDITQNMQALQQAKTNPKLKPEEVAQIDAQLKSLSVEQGNKLNAVNMMDREIQRKLATQKQAGPAETETKELMYQDEAGNYRFGLLDASGNVIKDLRAATDKEIKGDKDKPLDVGKYRQWVKQAETNAYKSLFANDETMMQEIAQLDSDISEDEKARIEAKIHRNLSPTQQAKLDELKETYFKNEAPKSIWNQYKEIKGSKRTGTKAVSDPLGLR